MVEANACIDVEERSSILRGRKYRMIRCAVLAVTMTAASLEISMKSVAKYEIAEYRSNERPC